MRAMSDYMIALDVGGTKTDGVIFTPDGKIHRHIITPGANPLDHGLPEAMRRYMHAIRELMGEDIPRVRTLYGGIAAAMYFGTKVPDGLREQAPADKVRVEADGISLISTMLGHVDGASLICGTGSSLNIRKGDVHDCIGGWGYLIDGCASGFILGKRAMLAALREYDGRGDKTLITELLVNRFGEHPANHLETLYGRGRPYIASLASTIFEARKAGDKVAAQIFDECVDDLRELVWTGRSRLGGAYTLVLNGGIFRNFPEYAQALKDVSPIDVTFIDSDAPPILGCAVEAMWDAGIECTKEFRKNFMESYNAK